MTGYAAWDVLDDDPRGSIVVNETHRTRWSVPRHGTGRGRASHRAVATRAPAMVLALLVAVVAPVASAAAQPGGGPSGFDRVDLAVTPSGEGAWLLAANGDITTVGDASPYGEPGIGDDAPQAAGIAAHPSGDGYWVADRSGTVWAFGSADHHGGVDFPLNQAIVGIAASPTGDGYWLAASDGGVFSFGDAAFLGSMGGTPLNEPVVGIAAARGHDGYWLVARDGGIFTFGDQGFHGSTGGMELNEPITAMSSTPTGDGYWLVGGDGGVFAFGDAEFRGSVHDRHDPRRGDEPFVAIEAAWGHDGYFLLSAGGDLLGFGDAAIGPEPPDGPGEGLPGGELVRCVNPEGFSIAHPAAWHTNSGDVVSPCSQFDREPFVVPHSDERVAAITAYIDPVPFTDAVAQREERGAERATTTIDGRQAVRLAYAAGEDGFWPAGTPITLYAVDLTPAGGGEPATLFLDTVGVGDTDHRTNEVVLDRMARTLRIERPDVPTDDRVVARYGGASGFSVEGSVEDDQACLRVPPGGGPVCTDIPDEREVRALTLTDLQPVLAGVAGTEVFAVTAELADGATSTVLPAPIGDGPTRGFAFAVGPDEIDTLTLIDVTGDVLGTVVPGVDERPERIELTYEFEGGSDGWASDISDFSDATRPDDLLSRTGASPPGLDAGEDFVQLAATNTSDDLFMYLRRPIGPAHGIEPGQGYEVGYTVEFASDAPTGCAGIGGAPGESVWLKVGATAVEPVPVAEDGEVRLSVDKGNQSQAGPAAAIAGDVANGIPCEEALAGDEQPYAMVERSATLEGAVTSAEDGSLWLFVGTDSGFEGRTSIYYDRIAVTLTPSDGDATCDADAPPASHEASARCLYRQFVDGALDVGTPYATDQAVAELLELGGFPTDDQWTFQGCGDPRESSPSSGVACHYSIPGEVHGVEVELAMRDDFVVEDVVAIG